MHRIVGITFNKKGRIYNFDAVDYHLELDEEVIVETEKGYQFGFVTTEIREIDEKTAELITLRREIDARIGLLNKLEEQLVLRYRYLEKLDWRQIERLTHISRSSLFKIHGEALVHFSVPADS